MCAGEKSIDTYKTSDLKQDYGSQNTAEHLKFRYYLETSVSF